MKKLLIALLLAPALAAATCQSVYDSMNQKWIYACTPDPTTPAAPVCQSQYDSMNQTWVMVCH